MTTVHTKPDSIYLVSCVSKKRDAPSRARDLYVSDWFVKARAHVEATRSTWFILSAEYGLLDPDAVVAPYERTLNRMRAAERRAWAARVLAALEPSLAGRHVALLAGERYGEHLVPALRAHGCRVEIPLEGLGIGEQLHWFIAQREGR
jgi:uncharacterized protein DUF6884